MIGRQEILDLAAQWKIAPNIIEKDYVLGWILAALAHQNELKNRWVFKGGTRFCISPQAHWGLFFETPV